MFGRASLPNFFVELDQLILVVAPVTQLSQVPPSQIMVCSMTHSPHVHTAVGSQTAGAGADRFAGQPSNSWSLEPECTDRASDLGFVVASGEEI
jgi:hypothetical protein